MRRERAGRSVGVRVLNVNKFHYRRGGAETAYFLLARLLESKGHEVVPFAMQDARNEPTPWSRLFPSGVDFQAPVDARAQLARAARVVYSREARDAMRRVLREAKPDLVHLHNFAHQLSPSILDALADSPAPVVQTLHDYKLTCPTYLHRTAAGEICERCKGGRVWNCVVHRCNDGSTLRSLVNAVEVGWHRARHTYDRIDLFLCPSRFLYAKCLEHEVPVERLEVLPNFLFAGDFAPSPPGRTVFFVGRLSEEKGLSTLLEAAARLPAAEVVIAGEGPDREALEAQARDLGIASRVRFAGFLSGEEFEHAWRDAALLVLPSRCWEVSPMVVQEAYARGRPVVAYRFGAVPEVVRDGETGVLVPPGDAAALAAALGSLLADPARLASMGRAARAFVEGELGAERHWRGLEAAYRRAAAAREAVAA
jgi:glycosyltransferase involved in cell wall biosynthesis